MKEQVKNKTYFCDRAAIEKARQRLALPSTEGQQRLAGLILSGSFNPVHTQHIRALSLTRKHVESLGWTVVIGLLAPSSQTYIEQKHGGGALSLRKRRMLCELAIKGSDWMGVCLKGEISSNTVCRRVQREIESYCADLLGGRRLTGLEIMGSDTVIRVFSKVLAQQKRMRVSRQRGRNICYLLRPSSEQASERKYIESIIAPGAAELGVTLTHIEPASGESPLEAVSSSAIRELVANGQWQTLRLKGWLQPAVLEVLQTWT